MYIIQLKIQYRDMYICIHIYEIMLNQYRRKISVIHQDKVSSRLHLI